MQTDPKELMTWLKRTATGVSTPRKERVFATLSSIKFRDGLQQLIDRGFNRLITITGNDIGKHIELIYHLVREDTVISIKTLVGKETAKHPTISDLLPAAILYEQEVHELFGVYFQGHPDLALLLLPDNWPPNVYPLRKDWSLSALANKLKETL
jgi:NADH:ubiquinone oxidoreductase subunit C